MPTVAQMSGFTGKYDGEIRMFRNGDLPGAYVNCLINYFVNQCWKQTTRTWDLVGEVVNTIPTK